MANPSHYTSAIAILLCMFSLLAFTITAISDRDDIPWRHGDYTQNWINHGGDIYNRRFAGNEVKISPETASKLRLKWKFFAGKDITATPAIYDGILYFPSWNGYVFAVRASKGSLLWKINLQEVTGLVPIEILGINHTVSRSTPTIAGDLLVIGIYGPAVVIAVNRWTGKLVWSTRMDSHSTGVITMSGTFCDGAYYIGTSSLEESLSIAQCCTFRGSFSKLNIRTGAIEWQTFMLPDNHGKTGEYAGAAIWGSSPSIDIPRKLVYIATGNLYSVPSSVEKCQEIENNQTRPTHPDTCIGPNIHSESILALDLDSGKIKWQNQLGGYDVWFAACANLSNPNCPPGPNPDADFGEAPMMLSVYNKEIKEDIVVTAQKSGYVWALTRDNGSVIWSTQAGPGGIVGGATWGAATDGKTVYTNIANSGATNFTLKPSAKNTTAGGWVALDAQSGEILWSTANPSNATSPGPVTLANGVLFAGSAHPKGPIYAMDAKTGNILWSYVTGGTVYGGMSVSNGCVYIGNGYTIGFGTFNPGFTGGTSLFSFCVT